MGLFKPKNPEEHRYYLLPGMARSNRRAHALALRWSIVAAIIISAVLGLIIYLVQSPRPFFY